MDNLVIEKLKKDIETVGEWRKEGKPLNKERQIFAEQVVDRMLTMRNQNKMGVHLISKDKLEFVQKYEASDRTSDETSYGSTKQGADVRVSHEVSDVAKSAKIKGDKPKEVPISSPEGKQIKQAPDVANTKLNPPDNQKEGEVTSVADDSGEAQADMKAPENEKIGHTPNEPMPKKQAEDLMNNAKWGVDIGAYTTLDEGIDRQLSRKAYAEFIDTPEKLTSVKAYLKEIGKEQTDPKAQV